MILSCCSRVSLVNRAESFDQMMVDLESLRIRSSQRCGLGGSTVALQDVVGLSDGELETLSATIDKLAELHSKGRDHIWAYYTRNLEVRPITLARNFGGFEPRCVRSAWRGSPTTKQVTVTIRFGDQLQPDYDGHLGMSWYFRARNIDVWDLG